MLFLGYMLVVIIKIFTANLTMLSFRKEGLWWLKICLRLAIIIKSFPLNFISKFLFFFLRIAHIVVLCRRECTFLNSNTKDLVQNRLSLLKAGMISSSTPGILFYQKITSLQEQNLPSLVTCNGKNVDS